MDRLEGVIFGLGLGVCALFTFLALPFLPVA
jgi:hypothetical protein